MGRDQGVPFLNERQVAEELNVSVRLLQAWRVAGRGPVYVKLGRQVRYRRPDLVEWIAANTVSPEGASPERRA